MLGSVLHDLLLGVNDVTRMISTRDLTGLIRNLNYGLTNVLTALLRSVRCLEGVLLGLVATNAS